MGGGGTTTSDTQSSSINQIPQWVSNAGQQNYALAQNIAERPLQQYQGQMVADVSPQTQQAWNLAASSGNIGQDQYQGATAGLLGALGQTPASVTDPGNAGMINAAQLSNTNLSPYMNPYTQSVINSTLPIMQQNLGLQQNQQQNAANAAGAFGGSRQAVQQGVTQAQGAMGMGQMAAQLNQGNFAQAQAAAQGDVAAQNQIAAQNQQAQQQNLNRNVGVQTTNQQAQQQKTLSDIMASGQLTGVGQTMQQGNAANFGMLSSAGASQQAQAQDQINAQMAKFNQAWGYPTQGLGMLESTLGMTPYDTATQGASQTQQTTPTNWGALALGGLQDLAGFMKPSDRRIKKNVVKIGRDPLTGVSIHSYNFKGQPAGAPKAVGPMAQDVQKVMPGAVAPIPGTQGAMPGGILGMHPTVAPAMTRRMLPTGAHIPRARFRPHGIPIAGALSG